MTGWWPAPAHRIRRIVKDKCGKPHLGLCWAVVVTLIAACITIGAAFAQTRPADTDQAKECEKLLAEEQQLKQLSEQLKLKQLEQQQLERLGNQLQLEQQQLERLDSQLQHQQFDQKKKAKATLQLRLAHLKNLNALAQQQVEYRIQADVIESEIKILQQDQDHMKKLAAESEPGLVLDKDENEVRKLEAEQLLAELKALREKIDNIESQLQKSLRVGQISKDPFRLTTQRDQIAQYKRNLQIEADSLQQRLSAEEAEIEIAEAHENMRATLEAIDNIRQRIRSTVPPTPADRDPLLKDSKLTASAESAFFDYDGDGDEDAPARLAVTG
jgi:chromosome segregation ATPase